jgi:hypothetical protein
VSSPEASLFIDLSVDAFFLDQASRLDEQRAASAVLVIVEP